MPKIRTTPDVDGYVNIAPGVKIHVDTLTAMQTPANLNENVSGSGIKLQDARVEVLHNVADVEGTPMRAFTIAFSVQREPATVGEQVAIDAKKGAVQTRKDKIAADAEAARLRLIADKDAEAAKIVQAVKDMAVAGNDQTSKALGSAFAAILQSGK